MAAVFYLSVDRYTAVAQRYARGSSGGYSWSWEMNGVLIQSIKNCTGGATVAHIHDAERWLHTRWEQRRKERKSCLWAHYCLFSTLLVTTKKNSASGHTCTHLNVANIIVAALLVTVWEIQQVSHSEERMIEDTGRNSPVFSSDEQHALQQGHKLLPVSLLCLHVTVIRTQHQVHLMGDSTEAQTQTKNWITQLKGHQFQSKPIQN